MSKAHFCHIFEQEYIVIKWHENMNLVDKKCHATLLKTFFVVGKFLVYPKFSVLWAPSDSDLLYTTEQRNPSPDYFYSCTDREQQSTIPLMAPQMQSVYTCSIVQRYVQYSS